MKRPAISPAFRPRSLADFPQGTCSAAGVLVDKNAGWRVLTPSIDLALCVGCLKCQLLCPEGVVYKHEGKVAIEYDFCKGCGVCAHECPVKAIGMKVENP